MGQIVFSQCNLDFHARIGIVAKHLNDAAHRLHMTLWLFYDLDDHDLAWFRATICPRRYQNVLTDPAILWRHHPDTVLIQKAADYLQIGPLEHFDNVPLAPAARADSTFARDHPVSVQYLCHFTGMQEQVFPFAIAYEKSETIGVALHPPLHKVEFVNDAYCILAIAHDLPVTLHGPQAAIEGLNLMGCNGKQFCHLAHFHRDSLF